MYHYKVFPRGIRFSRQELYVFSRKRSAHLEMLRNNSRENSLNSSLMHYFCSVMYGYTVWVAKYRACLPGWHAGAESAQIKSLRQLCRAVQQLLSNFTFLHFSQIHLYVLNHSICQSFVSLQFDFC